MRRLPRIRNLPTSMNLRLKRHRMNPIRMETFPNRLGKTVEINNNIAIENHMRRGKRLGLIQSPDVEFVDGQDTGDLFEVMLDVVVVDALWGALEEDEAGVFD